MKTLYESSEDVSSSASEQKGLVFDMVSECIELLNEPEKSQAVPACKIIALLIGSTRM